MVFKDEDNNTVIYNEYIMKNNEYESEAWKRDKMINKLCRKMKHHGMKCLIFVVPKKQRSVISLGMYRVRHKKQPPTL